MDTSKEATIALLTLKGAWTEAILTHYCQFVFTTTGKDPVTTRQEVRVIFDDLMEKHR